MYFIISNTDFEGFDSLEDLKKSIPPDIDGAPVNYGQGEGQVLMEGTVWGVYSIGNNAYKLQYEEGYVDWEPFKTLSESIAHHLKTTFGANAVVRVQGILDQFQHQENLKQ